MIDAVASELALRRVLDKLRDALQGDPRLKSFIEFADNSEVAPEITAEIQVLDTGPRTVYGIKVEPKNRPNEQDKMRAAKWHLDRAARLLS